MSFRSLVSPCVALHGLPRLSMALLQVRALLRHGASAEAVASGGTCAATAAAARGHAAVLAALADAGANLNVRGSQGLTPLEYIMRRTVVATAAVLEGLTSATTPVAKPLRMPSERPTGIQRPPTALPTLNPSLPPNPHPNR